jgi:hypothetical protein
MGGQLHAAMHHIVMRHETTDKSHYNDRWLRATLLRCRSMARPILPNGLKSQAN